MAATVLDQVVIVGNVGNLDNENAWYPANGDKNARFSFSVAVSSRVLNQATNQWEDGETTWHNVVAFGSIAENAHESLNKGDQVVIIGHNKSRKYTDRDGNEKTTTDIIVDYLGASLRYASVSITRNSKGNSAPAARQSSAPAAAPRRAAAPTSAPSADDISISDDSSFDELFN